MVLSERIATFLLASFLIIESTVGIDSYAPIVFADEKDCDKNDNNNCDDITKIQKLSPKVKCEIDSKIEHQSDDNVIGPSNLQCVNKSTGSIDSTIINSPSGGDDGDNPPPTVVSVDPQDGENNVPLNTEIKVTFDESMNQNTLDEGSLLIFNLDTGIAPDVQNADPSDTSVTYTLDQDLEPGTRYEAEISSDVQDVAGNFLDCTNSDAVDSSCRWQFETTGTTLSPTIALSPTSGPVGTSVTVTGTGFDPSSSVTMTFSGNPITTTPATVTSDNNGDFSANFTVPASSTGPHTVSATDGSNSASKTFTVTASGGGGGNTTTTLLVPF